MAARSMGHVSGFSALTPGKVYQWEDPDPKLFDSQDGPDPTDPTDPTAAFCLSQGDVYKELRLRGYDYGPHFQGVLEANLEGRVPRSRGRGGEQAWGSPPFRPHSIREPSWGWGWGRGVGEAVQGVRGHVEGRVP